MVRIEDLVLDMEENGYTRREIADFVDSLEEDGDPYFLYGVIEDEQD